MKKSKLLLLATLLCTFSTALCFSAVACKTKHTHTWSDWSITTAPTLTAGGKAEHSCTDNDGATEEIEVPALSNSEVWTKDTTKSTSATHTADGKDVYTSVYGEVELKTDSATGHTWGGWTLTVDPTLTATGKATRTCTANDGGSDTKNDVPALSDTTVWTKDTTKSTPATHTAAGKDVYTSSAYGEVEVTTEPTEHTWGGWTLTKDPTFDAVGIATRTCTANDGGLDTKTDVPALSDTTVWTKDTQKSTPATHTVGGKDVYTSSEYGEVEVATDPAGHAWGAWTLTQDPTLTATGKATRTCTANDGGVDNKNDVPALSNTSVWTKDTQKSTPATHTVGGVDVYTSIYGEVEVATDPAGHTWGAWVLGTEPTLDTVGTATRTCTANDGGIDTKTDVPVLSDDSVWTITEHTNATYGKGTTTVYESEYGTVTVEEDDAKPYPLAGKTYHSFALNGQNLNSSIYADTSKKTASITFDENGEGTSTAEPFNGKFKANVIDEDTGEISIVIEKDGVTATKKAYMHFETGVIIMPVSDSFNNVYVLVTTGEYDSGKETVTASAWEVGEVFNFAITYSVYGSGLPQYEHRIFIKDNVVYFDVSFTDLNGQQMTSLYTGSSLYKEAYVYIKDSNEELIAAYGYNKAVSNHVLLDGLEGDYDVTIVGEDGEDDVSLFLSGYGIATLTVDSTKYSGTYAVTEGNYDLLLETENGIYELTFGEDKTVTLVVVKVTVTYEMNGHGDQIPSEDVPKIRPFELPIPAEVTGWEFKGWYLEAACTTPAGTDGKFVFNENKTVYAKWAEILTITVEYGKEGLDLQTTYTAVDGDELEIDIPKGQHDNQVFEGFYTSSECTSGTEWFNGNVINAADGLTTIYAKWTSEVAYKGSYNGPEIYGTGATPTIGGKVTLTVDDLGNVTGNKEGNIEEYDKKTDSTGTIIIKASSSYVGAVDIVNGVIVYNWSSSGGTTLTNDIYVILRDKTNVSCVKTDVSQWDNGNTKLAKLTYDGGAMTVFVWNGLVWGDVSISSADGTSIAAGDAKDASSFAVIASDGKVIAIFKSGAFVSSDGLRGTYSNVSGSLGNIVLDGASGITAGESFGTYKITADNTIEAILTTPSQNVSTFSVYTIVLDKSNGTYVATEKSVKKVTVTIVYAQDGFSEDLQYTLEILAGTVPDLSARVPKGVNSLGRCFNGWFVDEERHTPYNSEVLTENKTIYAGWTSYTVEQVVKGKGTDTFVSSGGTSHANHQSKAEWNYSDINNGTWEVKNSNAEVDVSFILKITFDTAGTFSFDYYASFNDRSGNNYYDFLCAAKNPTTDWIHDQATNKNFLLEGGKSGNKSISVEAGDFILIEAYWDTVSSSANDRANVSNFQFVAA